MAKRLKRFQIVLINWQANKQTFWFPPVMPKPTDSDGRSDARHSLSQNGDLEGNALRDADLFFRNLVGTEQLTVSESWLLDLIERSKSPKYCPLHMCPHHEISVNEKCQVSEG